MLRNQTGEFQRLINLDRMNIPELEFSAIIENPLREFSLCVRPLLSYG